MLSVAEAIAAVLAEVHPFSSSPVSLNDAFGLTLAEDITSDVDSPPFDKSLMDGYAVRSVDVAAAGTSLRVIEEVTAGRVASRALGPGEATRIMTGAPIPEEADAVIAVELTQFDEATETVTITDGAISPGINVMLQGTSMKQGERVLQTGRILQPQDLAVAAELGRPEIHIRRRPRVAVLATGDELVPIDQIPKAGHIRNSNESMLVAQVQRAGGQPIPLGIAPDEETVLRARIESGLSADVLLLSGGVSAGKLDLVPAQLEALGVRCVFHKINLKPGKPVWFGVFDRAGSTAENSTSGRCLVFALPGNPVSSMVCFELLARSAMRCLVGIEPAEPRTIRARLAEDHIARGSRPTYYPARLQWEESGAVVRPATWHGSADLRSTIEANAMALFPAESRTFPAGERVDVISWE